MADPFESHIVSLILAWILSLPFIVCPIGAAVGVPFMVMREQEVPGRLAWPFAVWMTVCFLVLSPLRYLALQGVLACAFAVQTWQTAITGVVFLTPAPLILLVLWTLGLGLPVLGIPILLGDLRKPRFVLASVGLPVLCAGGYALFFLLLPFAAWTVRWWLPASEAMGATNGPSHYFYQFVVEPDVPRIGPELEKPRGASALARLRAHVLDTYVNPKKSTAIRVNLSMDYAQAADDMMRERVFSPLTDSEFGQIVNLFRAALREAEQVDSAVLEARVPGMSAAYRVKFVAGLRLVIQGCEEPKSLTNLRGAALMNEWADWYNTHLDQIRKGR